ncbi:11485_t:CDS:2 [Funneliformis geosporum]|uniref:3418_t:CDS:1 n=1 Tax=Funneliformis geosporum TaxID=1117311 RepID=A0A9W4WPK6_9GLOM|nr:11485_t:CDS:2 [Funneliformis geosporum]CAI2169388.1 3418_t:CDS:2 [Funneliformis geosporum]
MSFALPHDFEETTFSKPTYCDYCNKILWGLIKQGVCCRVCGYVSHTGCQEFSSKYCRKSEAPFHSNSDSLAASRSIPSNRVYNFSESIKSEPNIHQNEPIPIQRTRSNHTASESVPEIKVAFDKNQNEESSSQEQEHNLSGKILRRSNSADSITNYSSKSPKSKVHKSLKSYATLSNINSSSKATQFAAPRAAKPISTTKSSFDTKVIQDLIVSSVMNISNSSKSQSDSAHPPLNLNTTTNNFRKFVQKCGFIFELQNAVEDIIMWKNTPNTLLSMVIFVYVCLYPQLLILLPLIGLLSILISYFQKRYPDGPNMNENGKDGRKKGFRNTKHTDPYLPPENSVDYLKNMQNIQNLMGMISDGYDTVVPLLKHVDWSNGYETLKITQIVVVVLSFLSLTVWIVPWRYIFIVVGLSVFIANTQFMKALIREISPILMQREKVLAERWNKFLPSSENEVDQEDLNGVEAEVLIEQNYDEFKKEQ